MNDGLLSIDKHDGCTSHDVVAAARRILKIKKIGHCGTLDPAATGLLLLTVGRATRLTRFLIRAPKVYEGTARFGITTDTYDLTGEVTAEQPTDALTTDAIRAAMDGLVGTYLQTPPPYCARKVGGVRYYELARRGEKVPEDKKEVTVFELEPASEWRPGEDLAFRMACTSGTYARSLVHDLGERLGCGAILSGLRRLKIGGFEVAAAVRVDELRRRVDKGEPPGRCWIPFDEIPLPFDEVEVDARQERRLVNGQTALIHDLASREGDWLKVVNQRRQFVAVGSVVERIGTGGVGVVQPRVVFAGR